MAPVCPRVDVEQSVFVMVPDHMAPVWQGQVSLHPSVLRLLECFDGRSAALFKQLIRASAIEVDWDVRLHQVTTTRDQRNRRDT